MRTILNIVFVMLFAITLSCEKQEEVLDLKKIDSRTTLDETLKKIDEKIKDIRVDTLLSEQNELKEYDNEQQLTTMRDIILTKIDKIDSINKKDWDKFEAELDSLVKRAEESIEKAQQELTPGIGKAPYNPPTY